MIESFDPERDSVTALVLDALPPWEEVSGFIHGRGGVPFLNAARADKSELGICFMEEEASSEQARMILGYALDCRAAMERGEDVPPSSECGFGSIETTTNEVRGAASGASDAGEAWYSVRVAICLRDSLYSDYLVDGALHNSFVMACVHCPWSFDSRTDGAVSLSAAIGSRANSHLGIACAVLDALAFLHLSHITTAAAYGGEERRVFDQPITAYWWELSNQFRNARIGGKTRVGKCEHCGHAYIAAGERGNPRRYCSDACRQRARDARKRAARSNRHEQ